MKFSLLSKLKPGPQERRCRHSHADGSACKATPQRERPYCFFHDPELREKRLAASQTGGAHSRRRKRKRLEKVADVGEFLLNLINEVYSGKVDVRVGNSLARLTPLLLRVKDSMAEQKQPEKADAKPAVALPAWLLPYKDRVPASTAATEIKLGNPSAGKEHEGVSPAPDPAKNQDPEQQPGVPHSRPSASGNNNPAYYEIHQTQQTDALPGDMARKKLDAQELAIRKEIAYALAPTTMKYSMFNEEGLVVARPEGTPPEQPPAPVRDPDYEPSPIPGLQNRHLNYLKYAGMPVSELRRLGFIPSKWHSKFVRRW